MDGIRGGTCTYTQGTFHPDATRVVIVTVDALAEWERAHVALASPFHGGIYIIDRRRLSHSQLPRCRIYRHTHCSSESVCRYIRTIMFYVDLCNDYAIWRTTLCARDWERRSSPSCLVALVSRCSAGKHANRPSTHPTHTKRGHPKK